MTREEYEREIDEREMDISLARGGNKLMMRALMHVANVRQDGYMGAHCTLFRLGQELFFDACPQYKLPEYGWKGEVNK